MTTTDDLEHWDEHKLEMVMGATQDANQSLKKLGDTLDGSRDSLWNWGGDAAATWRAQHGKIRTDIDAQGHQTQKLHDELTKIYPEVKSVKNDYVQFKQDAAAAGLTVTSPGVVSCEDSSRQADVSAAQDKLNGILKRADAVDEEMAEAIRGATTPQAPAPPDTPKPAPPPPTPDQPKTDDTVPGPHDGDPPYKTGMKPTLAGSPGDHPPMHVAAGSSDTVSLADNPPGYNGPAGPERDAAWQHYLSQHCGATRGTVDPSLVLPNPGAVSDPGLKTLGAAAKQQGVTYAWGGGHGKDPGVSVGHKATAAEVGQQNIPDESWTYNDNNRTGFDCSGLARFATDAGHGGDLSGGTVTQEHTLTSQGRAPVADADLKPGDLIYYGPPGGSHHVVVYAGNGLVVQAHGSGEPVEVSPIDLSEQHRGYHP